MATWYLNRALTNFRNAVNAAYPNRDKASDGTIGDEAHQNTSSDHNPDADGSVDAWDMDVDLRSGNDAAAIEALKRVFQAHPSSRYWIHNRVICSRSTGWRREPYTGSNPHDKHVHWNTREAYENSSAPWILEDDVGTLEGKDAIRLGYVDAREEAFAKGTATIKPEADYGAGQSHWGVQTLIKHSAALSAIAADVAELKSRPVPGAVEITDEQLERVLRKVIGSVDSTTQA